jgi:hypothetical protein
VFLLRDGAPGREFLAHWQRRMVESGLSRDQPALARTVYDLPDLRLIVVNAVWSADEWEAANLFTVKREPPRILHYARPHHDLGAAQRLRRTLEGLLPNLPETLQGDADVQRVREKYRRITHPLFASRLTRLLYLLAAHRLGRLRGIADVDVLDRRSVARGRDYTRDNGTLWED